MARNFAFLKFCVAAGISILTASYTKITHAGELTIHGANETHIVTTRDRPPRNENVTGHIFRVSEMISKCALFKFQSAIDSRLIESIDSDIYSVSFRSANGDCGFWYEGAIRVPWSCEDNIYQECLRTVLEAGIGHQLLKMRYSDSIQVGAPADYPFKLYFTFASVPAHESRCRLLVDGMGNPSYEPGYIYFLMSVHLSMNCRDRGAE